MLCSALLCSALALLCSALLLLLPCSALLCSALLPDPLFKRVGRRSSGGKGGGKPPPWELVGVVELYTRVAIALAGVEIYLL
jgi:hypothetical protein